MLYSRVFRVDIDVGYVVDFVESRESNSDRRRVY
jgi:hypothetical protein